MMRISFLSTSEVLLALLWHSGRATWELGLGQGNCTLHMLSQGETAVVPSDEVGGVIVGVQLNRQV